ncbi:uncharacterized protein [Temnothorax nylanderi]|uniref:uncharacterized protein isoform X2 n=1 Tax=Temnothorax nylanderi TaxID=102681 RepID=UPI003A87D51C
MSNKDKTIPVSTCVACWKAPIFTGYNSVPIFSTGSEYWDAVIAFWSLIEQSSTFRRMVQQEAVVVRNAVKRYGKGQPVLDGLDMTVSRGSIYGLLGASGCGKTTLLSCVVGVRYLDSGEVWVLGGNPGGKSSGIPGPQVGYMPQDISLVGEFTMSDALYYFGRINGLDDEEIETRQRFFSKLLQLPPADHLVKNMSGGQQRRVSFAAALIHSPELLILDEPTVGLDPILRENIWAYLIEITQKEGITVLITTHYIEETKNASKIGLMRCGKLLAESPPQKLLEQFQCSFLEEAFLKLCKGQNDAIILNETQESKAEDTGSGSELMNQDQDKYEQTKGNSEYKTVSRRKVSRSKRFKALLAKNGIQFLRYYAECFVHVKNYFGNLEKIDRFKAWKDVSKIQKVIPYTTVCSLHFKKEDYILPDVVAKTRRLKKTAVPSCNLPSSTTRQTASVEADEARLQRQIRRNCQREELIKQRTEGSDVMQEKMTNEEESPAVVSKHEIPIEEAPSISAPSFRNAEVQVNSDYITPIIKFVNFIKNDSELSTSTGIASFAILNTIVEIVELVYKDKFGKSNIRMNIKDRIIMTYVKLKQNVSYSFLAIMFNCYTAKHCQRVFYEMIKILSKCLKVAIPWPSKEEIEKNLPLCFKDFEDVRVVVDCTEVFIQKPAKLCCQLLTYSHYKGSETCKIMTGVTPAENISYISKPYGGRVSDTVIFEQSNLVKLLQPGDAVMVDKGFLIDKVCELNRLKCIRPPFLKDKKQFTKAESILTCKIATARVYVERSNQRIKTFKIVGSKMPVALVSILEDIFVVICATINMSSPILSDNKFMEM